MAIRVCSYESIKELYALSFVNWKNDLPYALEIIVPSPDLADILRERLKSHPDFEKLSVSTISYFISKKLKSLNCPKPVIRKAQILLHFSTIWQKYFNDYDYALFSNAYEVFSDWRSYSTDLSLFEEALNALDPIIKKAVMFFWTYLTQMDFLDEHGAYDYLSQLEQIGNEQKDLMFYGFTHLSGTQISLLHNLARNCEIYLPVHAKMLDTNQSTDWVSWVSSIEKKSASKKIVELYFANWSIFERSELNSILNRKFEKCLLLGARDSLGHLSEIHENGDFFKTSYNFLEIEELNFSEKFKHALLLGNKEYCENFLEKEKLHSIDNKNWKKLKIIELYTEAMDFLAKVDLEYNYFVFSVVRQYVQLNLPRNYVLTINKNLEKEILKPEYLWAPDISLPIDVIIKGDDTIFMNGTIDYSAQVFKVLANIGPVQRLGLRGEWLKNHLKEVLSLGGEIFIEEGLLETSSFWKEQAKLNGERLNSKIENVKSKNYQWKIDTKNIDLTYLKEKIFSPSELQRYIDCPRSYFVTYVKPLDPKIDNVEEVTASAIGELEHSLIEQYFKKYEALDDEYLSAFALSLLENYLLEKNKIISNIDKEVILEELISYSFNVLEKLFRLRTLEGFEYEFEKKFINNDIGIQGRIDFFYQTVNGYGIIDFKRSKVPSYTDFSKVRAVQLWSYLFGLGLNLGNCTLEYFNLSSPEKSWGVGKSSASHFIKVPRGYQDDLEIDALSVLKNSIVALREDLSFSINPRRTDVCLFCPAHAFCSKTQTDQVEAACQI